METNFLTWCRLKNNFKSICFQTVLPAIISLEQAVYTEKWFTGEGGRLISDILSVINNLKMKSHLVTT